MKSLVAFPQVLEPMNEKLDWTQKLGDAFLADQKAVLDAVQRLRQQAREGGQPQDDRAAEGDHRGGGAAADRDQDRAGQPAGDLRAGLQPDRRLRGVGLSRVSALLLAAVPVATIPGGALMAGFAWGVGIAAAGAIFGGCNWGRGDVNIDVEPGHQHRPKLQSHQCGQGQVSGSTTRAIARASRTATREAATSIGKDVPGRDGRNDYRGRDGGPGRSGGAERRRTRRAWAGRSRWPRDRAGEGGPGDRGGAGRRSGRCGRRRSRRTGHAAIGGGAGDRGGPERGRSRRARRGRPRQCVPGRRAGAALRSATWTAVARAINRWRQSRWGASAGARPAAGGAARARAAAAEARAAVVVAAAGAVGGGRR